MAAARDSSVSTMLAAALRQIADQEQGYEEARRGMLADLRRGYNLGTQGKTARRRESVHERKALPDPDEPEPNMWGGL